MYIGNIHPRCSYDVKTGRSRPATGLTAYLVIKLSELEQCIVNEFRVCSKVLMCDSITLCYDYSVIHFYFIH